MKHLIICREYPPAPGGGIGTYVSHISRLLAESGETVHVIGQLWKGAEKEVEEDLGGRLIIHRVPYEDWGSGRGMRNPGVKSTEGKALFESYFPPQCFSWEAGLLAESLIDREGIDIIEAQEFEAPSYYLQLRRALGFGPKRSPPCIIHLHSPLEFIVRYNDWDITNPYFLTGKRLEDYSIAAADALLCPSHFLASQVETHYGLKKHRVKIIPYPLGDGCLLDRDKNTWKCGTICYVGRLEGRKGVIEWIDAAVSVARDYPEALFEFIGANILGTGRVSGDEFIESRIPRDLRSQFLFRGDQSRSELFTFLAGARIAVVPSRWENFPNVCIEAMCSGLPVIVSPNGGMVEMITEEQTGWIVNKAGHEGLAEALRRALQTAPQRIEQMGRKASEAIREMCGNEKILERHLKFRSIVTQQRASRSFHLPVNLPWAGTPFSDEPSQHIRKDGTPKGLAIVVICSNNGRFLSKCLQSIKRQVSRPASVVIVDARSNDAETLEAFDRAQKAGWHIIRTRPKGLGSIKNASIEAVLGSGLNPLGFSFLSAEDRLHSGFVTTCIAALERCPRSWSRLLLGPLYQCKQQNLDCSLPFLPVPVGVERCGAFQCNTDGSLARGW